MKRQLFVPFRLGQWVRFAVVGFLAGEMGGAGGCNANIPLDFPSTRSQQLQGALGAGAPLLVIIGAAFLALVALAVGIALLYVSSRMRFVLFDSVVAGECRIRRFWGQRGDPAWRYFLWQIGFALVTFFGLLLVFGPPLLLALFMGWFENPRDHLAPLILGGAVLFVLFMAAMLAIVLIQVLTKDFVVPQMALEGTTALEGWRRLRILMAADGWGYVSYLGMKVLLSIGATVVLGIIGLVVILVLLLPVGGFGALAVLGGQAAGLTWNPLTIAIVAVAGIIVVAALLFLGALIGTPATVFFPAYSMHFFAGRYAPLQAAMNSANAPPPDSLPTESA